MRRALLLAASILAGTGPSMVAWQQNESAAPPVHLRIVATDGRGRHVPGLSSKDVEIIEGTTTQPVQSLVPSPRGPRTVGILLDEYHVSAGPATELARAALLTFVERDLREADTVFLLKPLDPLTAMTPVSSREELRARIAAFNGRKGDYTPRGAFEAEFMSTSPPAAVRQRAQVVRAAMQALATNIGAGAEALPADAARAMIVVTEGFAAEDRGRERLATMRGISRASRFGNVAVYVLDPLPEVRQESPFTKSWQALAGDTGGLLVTEGQPLDPALSRIASDTTDYYVATIAGASKEDGIFHPLSVAVKRKDVSVRAPAGFWAPIAAERISPPMRPAMSTYLKTPHISGLIQPWFRMSRGEEGRTRITFSWTPKGPRISGGALTLSATTFEGVRLFDSPVPAQGSTSGAAVAAFSAAPGPLQVAMTLTDAKGKLVDTEVRYIDVPKLDSAGPLIAAVDLVRTRTVREFAQRQLEPDAMPADTREFDRQDRLIVRVRAFGQGSQGAEVPVVLVRLLNPLGQPLRELTALPAVDGIPQFDLPLFTYARGNYRLEIRATAGGLTTSQLITFRLRG